MHPPTTTPVPAHPPHPPPLHLLPCRPRCPVPAQPRGPRCPPSRHSEPPLPSWEQPSGPSLSQTHSVSGVSGLGLSVLKPGRGVCSCLCFYWGTPAALTDFLYGFTTHLLLGLDCGIRVRGQQCPQACLPASCHRQACRPVLRPPRASGSREPLHPGFSGPAGRLCPCPAGW